MSRRIPWVGVALIVVGVAMILARSGLVPHEWPFLAWILLTLFGISRLVRGLTAPGERGAIFWGTMFLGIGVYHVLEEMGLLWLPAEILIPSGVILAGAAFLVMYARQPLEWSFLVAALALLLIGGAVLAGEVGYLDSWAVADAVRMWWPIALILFGGALLLGRRRAG